jgi:MFS family permease
MCTFSRVSRQWEGCYLDSTFQVCQLSSGPPNTCESIRTDRLVYCEHHILKQISNYFDNPSGVVQGAIGSALAAGSVVGSIIAGPLSDRVGRRDALLYSCTFWLIGTALQVACTGRDMLIVGRIFNGITVGITSSQVPVYLADISKHSQRGAIIIIQQLAIEWGILIM